jgi:polyribonucleotide nucleotidyltransferase
MDVMRQALAQAKDGRLHILDHMYQCIAEPRADLKPQAPRIEQMIVEREFIGAIIGPGGKIIQEIQRETGTTISIEEVQDKGVVKIFSSDGDSLAKAKNWIKGIVAVPEVGETYDAVVKSIMPFGAFVEFMPGKQGLLHISEVSWKRLENLDGILAEGDELKVKLTGVDPKTGKYRLSRKELMPKPEGYVEKPERSERPERSDRGPRENRGPRPNGNGDRNNRPNNGERKAETPAPNSTNNTAE